MAEGNIEANDAASLVSIGRRNMAVRDYSGAVESLGKACQMLAAEHGDTGDQCAEPYLWYGKALLALSREESGVLGDGIAKDTPQDDEESDEGAEESEQNGLDCASEEKQESGDQTNGTKAIPDNDGKAETCAGDSNNHAGSSEPGTSNGDVKGDDDSATEIDDEDDVENIQLAWEMLELSRQVLSKRVESGDESALPMLAEAHLTLGEVALESETYDKAVIDMEKCLEIQKKLYGNNDRRIAETHYQIGLANSLSSHFEEAITHFKNAANILESRIKMLEDPASKEDATVKKFTASDPFYSMAGEIKELKELLPEIQEKIQDMIDYKAETMKHLRDTLCGRESNGSSSSSSAPPLPASDISHLVKRKRPSNEPEDGTPAKRANT